MIRRSWMRSMQGDSIISSIRPTQSWFGSMGPLGIHGNGKRGMDWLISLKLRKYTRSRDALRAIRPEGWHTYAVNVGDATYDAYWGYACQIEGDQIRTSGTLPTEELAELHAIIQAIEYERSSSDFSAARAD